ncbi:MAG TPA: GxxExxY protein [Gemmatimonadaceae bacterium]|nr:GxxExxY protein [Gemmatimonadaceae bacterium]
MRVASSRLRASSRTARPSGHDQRQSSGIAAHRVGDRRVLPGIQHAGFGFLEHVYVLALEYELLARGHRVAREVGVRVMYKGTELTTQRLDMLVDEKLVVEVKSTHDLHKAAPRQLYNYLRATNLELGLLFHFGPEPKSYRQVCRNARVDPTHPASPTHPFPS